MSKICCGYSLNREWICEEVDCFELVEVLFVLSVKNNEPIETKKIVRVMLAVCCTVCGMCIIYVKVGDVQVCRVCKDMTPSPLLWKHVYLYNWPPTDLMRSVTLSENAQRTQKIEIFDKKNNDKRRTFGENWYYPLPSM